MKSLLLTLLLVSAAGWEESCQPESNPPCDPKLWSRTYGAMKRFAEPPARAVLRHRCVTLTGTVVGRPSHERDGDVKIKLDLAPENFRRGGALYSFLTREQILQKSPHGHLTVEVVCVNPHKIIEAQRNEPNPAKKPFYQGMIDACAGYKNRVAIPEAGDTIAVVGELVRDSGASDKRDPDHGWYEVHPVTRIYILTKPSAPLYPSQNIPKPPGPLTQKH